MIDGKVNEKEKITRRNFINVGIELLTGAIIAAPVIYLLEKGEKEEQKLAKKNLILQGYSQEATEEIVTGKRFYIRVQTEEGYYKLLGERVKFSYEEWLKKYDESMRLAIGRGLFQDEFGKYYLRDLTKQERK